MMRGHHDMGGLPAGPIAATEHDYAVWEKRVDALMVLLSQQGRNLLNVDELRRNIESIGGNAYETMSYYERWVFSITQTMIQRGVISIEELNIKMAEVEQRTSSHGV
jgi:Nitrile hydratase beta subunit